MNQKTLFKKVGLVFLMACAASTATAEAVDDNLSFSAGIRLWNAQWQANNLASVGGKQVTSHSDSGAKLVAIPMIAVRYKDISISASHFIASNYSLSDGGNDPQNVSRSETDISLSYSLLPGLSASLGYKNINWTGISIKGPILALSGSTPVGSGFGLYGAAGIGWLDTVNKTTSASYNSDYALGEFGLSYSIDAKSDFLKGLTTTAGYRFQNIKAKGVPLTNNKVDFKDTTSGFTIGLIGRF